MTLTGDWRRMDNAHKTSVSYALMRTYDWHLKRSVDISIGYIIILVLTIFISIYYILIVVNTGGLSWLPLIIA